jgi:hypothetical protein
VEEFYNGVVREVRCEGYIDGPIVFDVHSKLDFTGAKTRRMNQL